MASRKKGLSAEEENRLRLLFHTYDADNSGQIEKDEFYTICRELSVPYQEADRIFNRLDVDKDGTVTLEEFISGFRDQQKDDDSESEDKNSSKSESDNEDQIISR